MTGTGDNADVTISVGLALKNLRKEAAMAKKVIKQGLMGGNSQGVSQGIKSFDKIEGRLNSINKAIGPVQKQFSGWALSIMFFGMALKRVFDTIWKSSSKTFNEVMHSVDGTVTGFDKLQGSMAYLGFTAGQALEPLAEMIVPIIDRVTEWVSQNESLFRGIMVGLLVFGTLLTLIGTLKLGFDGLFNAATLLGPVIKGIGVVLTGISTGALALIIIGIATLVAMWYTNFGGMRDFLKSTFGIIWTTVKSVWGNIEGIFVGFFKVLKGLFTGDLDLIMEGGKMVFVNFAAGVIKLFIGLGAMIANVFIFSMNLLSDVVFNTLKIIVGAIKKAIQQINKMPGINIPTSGIDKAIDKLEEWKMKNRTEYVSGDQINTALGVVDKASEYLLNDPSKTNILPADQVSTQAPNVSVYVELDGEQVANNVSSRVLDSAI